MKMIEIVNAAPSLKKLSDKDISIRTAYELSKLIRSLDEHLTFYEQKFNELLEKYCDLKNDRWYPKSSADHEKLETGKAELLGLEVDLGDFKKISIPCDENITLSAVDIIALDDFVDIKVEGMQ